MITKLLVLLIGIAAGIALYNLQYVIYFTSKYKYALRKRHVQVLAVTLGCLCFLGLLAVEASVAVMLLGFVCGVTLAVILQTKI